jgi:hypothetical protein
VISLTNIQDIITDSLQYKVDEYEVMNKSILDQMTKLIDYCSKLNRSISKACTQCGCIKIQTDKQPYNQKTNLLHDVLFENHCIGDMCPECKELVENYMGSCLYYLAALCNTLDLSLYDVILKELERIDILRKYNIE